MHLVLHDYSGHPFQVQLSRELARRGHDVDISTARRTPPVRVQLSGGQTTRLDSRLTHCVWQASLRVTRRSAACSKSSATAPRWRRLRSSPPDVVVMCNIPLLAHAVAAILLRLSKYRWCSGSKTSTATRLEPQLALASAGLSGADSR